MWCNEICGLVVVATAYQYLLLLFAYFICNYCLELSIWNFRLSYFNIFKFVFI